MTLQTNQSLPRPHLPQVRSGLKPSLIYGDENGVMSCFFLFFFLVFHWLNGMQERCADRTSPPRRTLQRLYLVAEVPPSSGSVRPASAALLLASVMRILPLSVGPTRVSPQSCAKKSYKSSLKFRRPMRDFGLPDPVAAAASVGFNFDFGAQRASGGMCARSCFQN